MISDDIYEKCVVVLEDENVNEDEKTEKVEDLLRKETSLQAKQLENAVLDTLWRFRESGTTGSSPRPSRHTVVRRASPALWQTNLPTPVSSSPKLTPSSTLSATASGFTRTLSSAVSPFPSPRPSPRLAFVSAQGARSSGQKAHDISSVNGLPDIVPDYWSDSIDWQTNDEVGSNTSSSHLSDGGLRAGLDDHVRPLMNDMSSFDMLRSILRYERNNEEIERALEMHNYDLSATINSLMDGKQNGSQQASSLFQEQNRRVTIGRSASPNFRPATPIGQTKSSIICKYWLSTGNCARADCRFTHDPSKTVCKYWLLGNCLAGDTCIFLHDNSALLANMMLEGSQTPPIHEVQPNVELQNYSEFPTLQASTSRPGSSQTKIGALEQNVTSTSLTPLPSNFSAKSFNRSKTSSCTLSRPTSYHQPRSSTPFLPSADDDEAFPTLGSGTAHKRTKKAQSRRNEPLEGQEQVAQSLADIVRNSPSPSPVLLQKAVKSNKTENKTNENSERAKVIPPPEHIPWLETGDDVNSAYLKARQEAFKHGALRNKFLQSAAQAWNRNDSRAAKALSLRGQSENSLMREAHREAASILYEGRNKGRGLNAKQLFIDLHGLHPEEAVSYIEEVLLEQGSSSRPLYAITGTGHHSKSGRVKVTKAVRAFLDEWRYAFKEFSVPGDKNNYGGILGIDPKSWDRNLELRKSDADKSSENNDNDIVGRSGLGRGKITVVKGFEIPSKSG